MSYTTYLWIARVLWFTIVFGFILAASGVKPSLLEPLGPLAGMYLFVAFRSRQLRPNQACADRV